MTSHSRVVLFLVGHGSFDDLADVYRFKVGTQWLTPEEIEDAITTGCHVTSINPSCYAGRWTKTKIGASWLVQTNPHFYNGSLFVKGTVEALVTKVLVTPTYEKSYPGKECADSPADQIWHTGDEELLDTFNERTKIISDQIMAQTSCLSSESGLFFAAVQENWEDSFAKLTGLSVKGTVSGWAALKNYENEKPSERRASDPAEAGYDVHKSKLPLSRCVQLRCNEDDPESVWDVLKERILLYLGGYTGSAIDRIK